MSSRIATDLPRMLAVVHTTTTGRGCPAPDVRVGSPPLAHRPGLGALYAFPALGLAALAVSAVSLGIAASAIETFTSLAIAKTPTASRRRLAERGVIQSEVAQATSLLRSARAYFYAAVDEAWQQASADEAMSTDVRTNLRLAATRATANSAQAVDAMYTAGGGTSNFSSSPLQRCFRDVHAITQHISVAPTTWELCGRFLLGLDTDDSAL